MMRVGFFEKRRGQRIAAQWRRLVYGRLAWAWLLGVVISLISLAQALAGDPSSPLTPAKATPAPHSESLKPISLAAGNVSVTIASIAKDKPYAIGAPVFVEITLGARTPHAHSVAEIALAPERAALGTILAEDAVLKRNGDVLFVAFDGRPTPGRRPRVLVEVTSQKSAQAMSALTIALRKPHKNALLPRLELLRRVPGLPEPRVMRSPTPRPEPVSARAGDALVEDVSQGPESAARLEWPVADCAGAYYSALRTVYEREAGSLKTALHAARRAIRSYPRRWAFNPNLRSRAGRCLRWRRRRCVARAVVIADNSFPSREEREILIQAGRALSRGGVDPSLNRRADTGWATGKALSDVTLYLRQPQSPSLCAGGDRFVGYYEKRLSGLSDRAKTLAQLAKQALKIARRRTHEAHQAQRALPGGHPGWGGAGLSAAAQTEPVVAQDMPALAEIAAHFSGLTRLMGVAEPSPATRTPVSAEKSSGSAAESATWETQIASVLAVLNAAERAWIVHNAALAPALRAPLHAALVMNEAAFHLSVLEHRYRALAKAVFGTLDSIRTAHNQSCICAAD